MDVKPMLKYSMAILGTLLVGSGCSAIYPMRGVPAAYMPNEYKAETREGKSTIDLALLQRSQSSQYLVEGGDVLAVYAPGLLGLVDTQPDQPRGENPPINLPQNTVDRPSLGFPVTVREDHTIQIPQLPAIDVYRLTVREVEDRLKQAVQQTGLLARDTQPRIVVSIMRPRTYRVLVYRQEPITAPPSIMFPGTFDSGRTGKGTSRVVDLRAGENDVAHALAQLGVDGLPGTDARNMIFVIRARNNRGQCATPPRGEAQPTPLVRRSPGHSYRGQVVRGQSPSRFAGHSSAASKGPYEYMTASQFNLSGREVARGSNGPALIDPIASMTPANDHAIGAGHSRSTGDGSAFRNPNSSPRNSAGASGSPYALSLPSVEEDSPPPSAYEPVQYSPDPAAGPQSPPTQDSRLPVQPGFTPNPINTPVMGGPAMGNPVIPRYPSGHGAVVIAPVMTGPGMSNPGKPNPNMSNPFAPNQMQPGQMQPSQMQPGLTGTGPMQPDPAPVRDEYPQEHAPAWTQTLNNFDPTVSGSHVIKIPVRLAPGEDPNISEEDITLYDGDIVFIDNRENDVYFIGGLLGGGQYPLPRDRDLHVLEAISMAQGQNASRPGSQGLQSSGGVSALNRDITPGASRLLILRKVGCGQIVTLEVDIYKALKYPHENLLVQPGDMLILQYTPAEATLAFLQRNLFEGALLGIAAGSLRTGGR